MQKWEAIYPVRCNHRPPFAVGMSVVCNVGEEKRSTEGSPTKRPILPSMLRHDK